MPTDLFFGVPIDPLSIGGKAIALLLAVLLGGLVGLEREWHGNAAGMRTHILVCLGATTITITSVEVGLRAPHGGGDPGHIAAQIVSGIGFLGAGAIMREGASIRGLTTAASLWAMAGVGIAIGASPQLAEMAVIATLIVLGTLTILTSLERALKLKTAILTLEVEIHETEDGPAHILALLNSLGFTVYGMQSEASPSSLKKGEMEVTRLMRLRVQAPPKFDRNAFNTHMAGESRVVAFHLD